MSKLHKSLFNNILELASLVATDRQWAILKGKGKVTSYRNSHHSLETVKLLYSAAGRVYEDFSANATPAGGMKFAKYLFTYNIGKKVTLTMKSWLFILMQIATLTYSKVNGRTTTPKEKMIYALGLLQDDGTLNYDELIYKWKHDLVKYKTEDGQTVVKDMEVIQELAGLILAFNKPAKHGYYGLAFIDAKAQNWTLFATLFSRNKELMKMLNINVDDEREWYDIPPADFNSKNLKEFYKYFDVDEEDKHMISRDVPKFITMTVGYGSSTKNSIKKAISETDEEYRTWIKAFLNKNYKRIDEFMNIIIPGFADYAMLFRDKLAKTNAGKNGVYAFDILGKGYAFAKTETYNHNLEYQHPILLNRKVERITSEKRVLQNSYELFKMAFSTHSIDAWLVHFTRTFMYKKYNIHIGSNHDSYGSHPEYAFDVMDAYLLGTKILVSSYDGNILGYLVEQWGGSREELKKIWNPSEQELYRVVTSLNNVYMINSIFA
jgi:hypothetical protein